MEAVQRHPQMKNLMRKTTNPQKEKMNRQTMKMMTMMMRKMKMTLLRTLQRKSKMRCVNQIELMWQIYAGKGEIIHTSQLAKFEA